MEAQQKSATIPGLAPPKTEEELQEERHVEAVQKALGDRYVLTGQTVGAGGMGRIYLATAKDGFGRKVVVKTPHPGLKDVDGDLLLRFRVEAEILARLRHQNVVRVLEQGGGRKGAENGTPAYIVMEFLEGPNLQAYLRNGTGPKVSYVRKDEAGLACATLRLDDAVEIIRGAAHGLRAVHGGGATHRDIKPANIIVERTSVLPGMPLSGTLTPVLVDFGLAKPKQAMPSIRHGGTFIEGPKTRQGFFWGSFAYTDPTRLAFGNEPDGPLNDVYSLGCVFYELLTGQPPHLAHFLQEGVDEGNMAPWFAVHAEKRPYLPATKLRPDLPAWVDAFFLKALARDQKARFQDMNEFLAALDEYPSRISAEVPSEQRVTVVPPSPAVPDEIEFLDRPWVAAVGKGIAILCMLVILAGLVSIAFKKGRARPRAIGPVSHASIEIPTALEPTVPDAGVPVVDVPVPSEDVTSVADASSIVLILDVPAPAYPPPTARHRPHRPRYQPQCGFDPVLQVFNPCRPVDPR